MSRTHVERVSRHPPQLALALSQVLLYFGDVFDDVFVVFDSVLVSF